MTDGFINSVPVDITEWKPKVIKYGVGGISDQNSCYVLERGVSSELTLAPNEY